MFLSDGERNGIANWFRALRDSIRDAMLALESEYLDIIKSHKNLLTHYPNGLKVQPDLQVKLWQHPKAGGGEVSLLHGNLWEKAGVNFCAVKGRFTDEFSKQMKYHDSDPSFWASGVSIVTHPLNPFVPPVHMNVRCICTATRAWFAGALDLNPIYAVDEDTEYFHAQIHLTCAQFDAEYYLKFKQWCDKYFFLHHRNEPRGVGGIFFDDLTISKPDNNIDDAKHYQFTQAIGRLLMPIYQTIVKKHWHTNWHADHSKHQMHRRSRYAEFNLIYDQGIKFGLANGANIDGMFMSLPPRVTWY